MSSSKKRHGPHRGCVVELGAIDLDERGALDLAASINMGFGYCGTGEGGHLWCFMLSIHPQKREKWWFGRFARRGA